MRPLKDLIVCCVAVMAGILLLAELRDSLSHKEEPVERKVTRDLHRVAPIHPISPVLPTTEMKPSETSKASLPTESGRLKRFEILRKKVLLNDEESIERERILSHTKTIESIAGDLLDPKKAIYLKNRLSRIDFLEDAVSWENNPVRNDVFSQIEHVISSGAFQEANGDMKRQFIGDKIELFTILSQQSPEKAALLLEQAKGTKLESILKYASTRLNLNHHKSEE